MSPLDLFLYVLAVVGGIVAAPIVIFAVCLVVAAGVLVFAFVVTKIDERRERQTIAERLAAARQKGGQA